MTEPQNPGDDLVGTATGPVLDKRPETRSNSTDDDIRARALKRLKKRRDFGAHLLVYVLVNTFLITIWVVTSSGFFWPIFPIVGWGIGVVMNAWDVWRGDDFDEAQIAREINRMQRSQ